MLTKLLEPIAYVGIAVSLVVGAYHAGKLKEREWWRTEIAAKSSRVQAAMKKMDADADEFDAVLIRMIGDDDAKLADLEAKVAAVPAALPATPGAADTGDVCRPVPAHCLRRQGPGDHPARGAASGQRAADGPAVGPPLLAKGR